MKDILSFNFYSLFIGFLLTINDLLSFGMCKYIHSNNINIYYLLLPSIMYGFQIPLFFYGLNVSSMTELNIIWNLMSIILVTILGLFYFKEKISGIKTIALFLGLVSLILFSLDSFK
jgi:drug/metabolite transporter (DMT)-like permease